MDDNAVHAHIMNMVNEASRIYSIRDTVALKEAVLDDYEYDLEELKKVTVRDVVEISDASGIE